MFRRVWYVMEFLSSPGAPGIESSQHLFYSSQNELIVNNGFFVFETYLEQKQTFLLAK